MTPAQRRVLLRPKRPWFTSFAATAGVTFRQGTMVGIERGYPNSAGDNYNVHLWSQLKRGVWAKFRLDNNDHTSRLSNRKIVFAETFHVYRALNLTKSGTWTALTTSGSGVTAKYVSNTAVSNATANAYVETSVVAPADGKPYDVWVAYTNRTSGGYAVPYIDGVQTLVDAAIVDPAVLGVRAFSCYGAVDNLHRQMVKIASRLTGDHTVRVLVFGSSIKPAGSSGQTVTVEAILRTGDVNESGVLPPTLTDGQVVTAGEEYSYNGVYYCASTSATQSTPLPVHISGSSASGGVTWSASTDTSYLINPKEIDYASEREYAIVLAVISATANDIGGQTHGNETLGSRTIKVDGVTWDEAGAFGTITFGSEVVIDEALTWTHSAAVGDIASATLTRRFTPGRFTTRLGSIALQAGLTIATAYPAMMPAVRFDDNYDVDIFTKLQSETGTILTFDDYAGANTIVDLGRTRSACLYGNFGNYLAAYACRVTAQSMKDYANTGSKATVQTNINSRASAVTGADWTLKVYFERAVAGNVEAVASGDTLTFETEHLFGVSA